MMGMRSPLRKRLGLRLRQRLLRLRIVSLDEIYESWGLSTFSNEISIVWIEELKRVFC